MVKLNIEELLRKKEKSKYLLCMKTGISNKNLNKLIDGETSSISFKYIELFCYYLECTPNELFTVDTKEINYLET